MVSRKGYWGALSLLETPLIRVLMLAGISDGGYNVKESIFAGICLVVSQDTIGLDEGRQVLVKDSEGLRDGDQFWCFKHRFLSES